MSKTIAQTEIAPGVFAIEDRVLMPLGLSFPCRSIAILLKDGWWIHAPFALDQNIQAFLLQKAPVAHLVSPNLYHHLALQRWVAAFPEAKLWAPGRLKRKRPDLAQISSLSEWRSASWAQEIQAFPLEGAPRLDEWLFYHPVSCSLLLTDLLFNMGEEQPWKTRLLLRAVGTYGRLAPSRLFHFLVRDHKRFAAGIQPALSNQIHRVTLAHGQILESHARERLIEALSLRFGNRTF